MIEKNETVELKIIDYAFQGKGIAKISGEKETDKKFIVFVNGAYPGDTVKAVVFKKKRTFAEAKTVEVVKPSEFRVIPKCKYFGSCGGCKQQDLDYTKQTEYKELQTADTFKHIGGFDDLTIESILPAKQIFGYRNKMEFSFSDKRWLTKEEIEKSGDIRDRSFALGLHVPRVYDKALDIDECFIQPDVGNKILNFTRDYFKSMGSSIYSTNTHKGYLRNLVIRKSFSSGDLMVNLVTSEENEKLLLEFSNRITAGIPEITTVINNINTKKGQTAFGDYEKVFFGSGVIYDSIGKYKFRISANSFFQTNSVQAEKLYQTALEFADPSGKEIMFDFYSGAGTIAVYFSEYIRQAYGFESVASAVADAKVNAELNKVANMNFFETNLDRSCMPIIENNNLPKPDLIVADPPRGGMNPRTVNDIIKLQPKKVVYISCNPATQARDIKLLTLKGYKLIKMRPVDMFPHSFHIENVALLTQ